MSNAALLVLIAMKEGKYSNPSARANQRDLLATDLLKTLNETVGITVTDGVRVVGEDAARTRAVQPTSSESTLLSTLAARQAKCGAR